MWADPPAPQSLLKTISDAWPVIAACIAAVGGVLSFFFRSKTSDKEIVALTKTSEVLLKTMASIEAKQQTIQATGDLNAQRITDACKDVTLLRDRTDTNTADISYMLGRMDFGARSRSKPERSG